MTDEQHTNSLPIKMNSPSILNSDICARILMLAELKHGYEFRFGTVTTEHPELIKLLGHYQEIKKYFYWMSAKGLVSIVDEQLEETIRPRLHIILTGKGLREARYLKQLCEHI